jgi:hypothetical protein
MDMKKAILFIFLGFSFWARTNGQERIIDIHMHATKLSSPGCAFCAYATVPPSGSRLFSTDTSTPGDSWSLKSDPASLLSFLLFIRSECGKP